MSQYTKSTDFASKDSLLTGNPLKVIKGTEIDDEFNSIQTAINSKADVNSPALTGTPTAATASTGTNTTQLATTAFVNNSIDTALAGADGTGLEESSGVLSISDTGVVADTYGSATEVPEITVNAQGQITEATTNSIVFPTMSMTIVNADANIGDVHNLATDTFLISGHAYVSTGSSNGGRLDIEIYSGASGSGTLLDTVKAFGGNENRGNDGGSGMSVSGTWTILLPSNARSIKFVRGVGGRDPDPITIESHMTYTGYHS